MFEWLEQIPATSIYDINQLQAAYPAVWRAGGEDG